MNQQRENIQKTLKTLNEFKNAASLLEATILYDDTKDFLLNTPQTLLHDVEHFLLPQGTKPSSATAAIWLDAADLQLRSAYKMLLLAQDLVARYGPNLRVRGE